MNYLQQRPATGSILSGVLASPRMIVVTSIRPNNRLDYERAAATEEEGNLALPTIDKTD